MATNYNKPLDENIIILWKGLFLNFDAFFFKKACLKLIATSKFFPNASEIIEAYQFVRNEAERERYEKLKENHRLLSAGQAYCYLCNNSSYCYYTVEGYEYVARCICAHGQDLNKFHEAQIKSDYKPELREHYSERNKSAIKRGENPFYFPTVKESLKEDFAVYEARKKEKHLSRNDLSDEEKLVVLRKMENIIK
jgi:hypothetical protein